MPAIQLILVLLFATLIIVWARVSALIIEAERRQQLIVQQSVGCHSSQGWVGCSIMCHRPRSVVQIENLLGERYERYELIAIIDATADEELFSTLVQRYGLIQLNAPQQSIGNSPAATIRSLYRSKQRRYRPLVLLDIEESQSQEAALNSALMVTSYNYVIPICGGTHLRPHAIESIAITLADHSEQEIELLESLAGNPCQIFRYDTVVAKGGFSASLTDKIAPRKRLYTFEAYICKTNNATNRFTRHLSPRRKRLILTLILILCVAFAATLWATIYHKILPLATTSAAPDYTLAALATLSTALVLAAITAHCRAACSTKECESECTKERSTKRSTKCSLRTILCSFRRTRAIFLRGKFIVS